MDNNVVAKHILDVAVGLEKKSKAELITELSDIFDNASKIDLNSKENINSLKSLAKAFEAIFSKAGDKSINFADLIEMPPPAMFAEMGKIAATSFWDAWNSVSGGMGGNATKEMMREQAKQLEAQRAELIKRQKALPKRQREYEDLSAVVDDLPYMDENEFSAFAKDEIKKMGGNVEKIALDMQQALVDALDDLSDTKLDDPKYDAILEDTLKKARNVFKMSRTLEKHPDLVKDKTILEEYDFEYLKENYMDDLADELGNHSTRLGNLIRQVDEELGKIPLQLQEIDNQLAQIKNSGIDIVDQASAKDGLKTLNEIKEAYEKIRVAQGNRIDKREAEHILSALEFDPAKSSKGIKVLYDQYKEAVASGDWVEEYRALLKYVRLYESYLTTTNKAHSNKITKKDNPFTPLYERLKPMADNAQNMLQNILNMGEGKPLVGLGGTGSGSAGGGPTPEDVANAQKVKEETEAKLRVEKEAREETEKRLLAEKEIEESLKKQRAEEEKLAKAVKKSADEAERELKAKKESMSYTAYRAVQPLEGSADPKKESLETWGAEYFATHKDTAASYGENFYRKGDIVIGEITPKKPLIINANGARWDEFEKMSGIQEVLPKFMDAIRDNPQWTGDDKQKYINERAREMGYDSVITENVQDALDGDKKHYELDTTIAVLDDSIVRLTGSMEQLEAGTNKFSDKISSEIPSYYIEDAQQSTGDAQDRVESINKEANAHRENTNIIREEIDAQEQLNSVQNQVTDVDDDTEVIAKENGALEDKLELLQEISEQYGNNISQKQRDRYEELNQKDMNEGLTPKEDERYWELGEQIEEADSALEEFGQTYDKIIVKLENGKKIEILPDDKGLRTLAKIDEEYGESYNGVEIEDVVFERVKQKAVGAEQAVDGLNESLEKTQQLTSGDGTGSGVGDGSSSELENLRHQLEAKDTEITEANRKREEAELAERAAQAETAAERHATDAAEAQLAEANQRTKEAEERAYMYDRAMTSMEEEMADLRGQLANTKTGGGEGYSSVSSEELKNVLNSIVYNVKIAHDDSDKTANKIALDDSTLEATLTKVFANILNPQTQQNDSEQKQAPWALENTLQTVKGVLDNIHTNTSKIGTIAPSNVDAIAGTALDGRLAEIKSVLESIDGKIAKGGVIATRGAVKQANAQAVESDAKTQAARSNMMKSLINDYKTLGKLSAKFASDNNLETKAMLENLKEEISRKRKSLKLTMDESASLREKYSVAFDAEKRLLDAEKAQKEINAQIKADAKEAETAWKKQVKDAQRATGINAATSAANAGDQTVVRAIGTEGISKDIEGKAKELAERIKTLRMLRDEIDKKGDQASVEDRDNLSKQIAKVKELKTEVDGYLKIHEKYSGEGATQFNDVDTSNFGAVGTDQYWNNITEAIKNASSGRVAIKGMNTDTGELTGTTKIAANTFAEWSATVDPVTGKLSMLRTGIKRTETIIESITRKTKEIFTYFSGSSIIFKAFNELKKGVQYVRDIDLALTELKKVTDETEETYDRFLETAAKTGARLGTTISAVTEATATFAKLGYSMKQATEMAEAAIVYKNVGDNIESTGDAADSIISTMKGFRLEASESMAIVDRFNEVGKSIARVIQ